MLSATIPCTEYSNIVITGDLASPMKVEVEMSYYPSLLFYPKGPRHPNRLRYAYLSEESILVFVEK
jgi:hypothetical protein